VVVVLPWLQPVILGSICTKEVSQINNGHSQYANNYPAGTGSGQSSKMYGTNSNRKVMGFLKQKQ
jgi:hypothetical protein